MELTEHLKDELSKLSTKSKAEIMQSFADEFSTISQFHEYTKIPTRTIYAKFGKEIPGFEFCGVKFVYF